MYLNDIKIFIQIMLDRQIILEILNTNILKRIFNVPCTLKSDLKTSYLNLTANTA